MLLRSSLCRYFFPIIIEFGFFILTSDVCPLYDDLVLSSFVFLWMMEKHHGLTIVHENKGIYVDYLGRAYCYWTEGTGSKKESQTATEIYLEERQYLFGSRTGGKHVILIEVFVLYLYFSHTVST